MLLGQLQLLAQEMTDQEAAEAAVAAGGVIAAILAFLAAFAVVIAVVALFFAACFWKVFSKAGQPGWAAFVPIYNVVLLLQIVGRPLWWIFLLIIPGINLIVGIILYIDLAKSYGKDIMFALGLIAVSPLFLPILAFGSAQYQGPAALADGGAAPAGDGGDPPAGDDSDAPAGDDSDAPSEG